MSVRLALAAFAAAALLGVVLNAFVSRLSRKLGFLDVPGGRKAHSAPVPLGGGAAIFLSMAAVFWAFAALSPARPDLGAYAAFFAAAALVCLSGLYDDARSLRPAVKLAVQAAAALVLYAAGFRITAFVYSPLVNVVLTVGWIVVITNAFNLLDSMDGLSAGVALAVAVMAFAALAGRIEPGPGLLLAVTAGAAAGFLPHNFPPARLYMGDAGSLLLGFSLAAATADATFYSREWEVYPLLAMASPLLLFAVPLYDTLSVCLIRIREGRSILAADRSHLPHRLLALGLDKREVLSVVVLMTVLTGAAASYIPALSHFQALLVLLQVAGMFAVMFILETAGERKR